MAYYISMIVDSMAMNFDKDVSYILFLILKNYERKLFKLNSIHQITAHIISVLEK